MALTNKQQRNVEALIDQHFDEVRKDLWTRQQAEPWATVEITPELKDVVEAYAKVQETLDRSTLDALKIYNDGLVSLGFGAQVVPYTLTGTQTTENRVEGLVGRVVIDEKNRRNHATRVRYEAALEQVETAWRKARRDVLILSLDGSDALKMIEALPTVEAFLTEE